VKLTNRTLSAWTVAVASRWSAHAGRDLTQLRSQLRAWRAAEDLRPIGAHLGGKGHDLSDVLQWFALLSDASRVACRRLGKPASVAALSGGWAHGAMLAAQNAADSHLQSLAS